jgi:hypothetical protein
MIYLMSNHSSVWELRQRGRDMGWLIGCDGWRRPVRDGHAPMPYALDNGMYFAPGRLPHGPDRLCEFLGRCGKAMEFHAPLFAVVPDMPYDAEETLRRYLRWIEPCRDLAPLWRWAIAVQNGMTPLDLRSVGVASLPSLSAVCVGGDSEWKDASIETWAAWCRARGIWCHVLRVNNEARLRLCQDAGVDSVDGTGLFRGDLPAAEASVLGADPARAVDDDGFGRYGRP